MEGVEIERERGLESRDEFGIMDWRKEYWGYPVCKRRSKSEEKKEDI